MRVRRVVVVPYSAAAMFALADDIEAYPEFLPWCARTEVARSGEQVRAAMHIHYCGLKTSLTTDNRHVPPSCIDMTLADGPLKFLNGKWQFSDLADGRCRVEFALDYLFKQRILDAVFVRLFDAVFGRFVDSFVKQAEVRYGTAESGRIRVAVACADAGERQLSLATGATVGDALAAGGYEDAESVGIFGRICGRQTPLANGDRVEIYRPLAQDPRTARRARADS